MTQHAKFLDRLAKSSAAVFAVAQHQHAKGRTVEIHPIKMAPTAAEHEAYVDTGDLFIVVRKRIEVKHRSIYFTGRADFPFPDIFVSNVAAVDRAGDSVFAYVTVSQDLKFAAVIHHHTKPHWFVVECLASNTGNVERNYACPVEYVVFEALTVEPKPSAAAEAVKRHQQFEYISGLTDEERHERSASVQHSAAK